MHPQGSTGSVIVPNTSLIGQGARSAEAKNTVLIGGPGPHPVRRAGGLRFRFHEDTIRWHPPTVLVQLPWGVGLDQAIGCYGKAWQNPMPSGPSGKGLRLYKPSGMAEAVSSPLPALSL